MAALIASPLTTPRNLCSLQVSLSQFNLSSTFPSSLSYAPLKVSASKKLQGTVVGTARDKTISVEVRRIAPHPLYKKRILTSKKYHVHDPENTCNVGDWVTLAKCPPISKTKRFTVADIRRARVAGASRYSVDEVESELNLPSETDQSWREPRHFRVGKSRAYIWDGGDCRR